MVDKIKAGLGLLGKLLTWKDIVHSFSSSEEGEEEDSSLSAKKDTEPMKKAYWDSEKVKFSNQNQDSIDLFRNQNYAPSRIPDIIEQPTKESHYYFNIPIPYLRDNENDISKLAAPEPPKVGTGISSGGRDAGVVAGIVVAVISGVVILAALIAVVLYRHYVHRNVTSMNFDNPVYRKTTEDQFALEKNGYAPGNKLYLSTVGEEAQEPLNTPGTNEFV